ncbi:MAG TPA: GNAT family N-acetyltransferase, partial [Thermoanaerobaculia bacterium]|nr:GNAT family N-acetyltransferase [Thermoanaerobaculia bacterium]
EIAFRPIEEADTDLLARLYASTRWEELAAVDWTDEQKTAFLRFQFDAQSDHYRKHYPNASFDVVLVDGEPAGRLYVDEWEREIRLVDVALFPEHRGRGIGTRLLRGLMERAERAGKALSIHVEGFNPALRLYERLGFARVGEHGPYLLMEWRPQTARPPA